METAKQNTQQNIEENDALKQFMGLLNRRAWRTVTRFYGAFSICGRYAATAAVMTDELQGVKEQLSQLRENQPKTVTESLVDKVTHLQENRKPVGTLVSSKRSFSRNSNTGIQCF